MKTRDHTDDFHRWAVILLIGLIQAIWGAPLAAKPKIAFVSTRDGNKEIYTIEADGKNPHRLTKHKAIDLQPTWSPDGREIAFFSNRDGNSEIYVMNARGTQLRNLTNHPASDRLPAWSPDGRRIAFVS